MYAKTTRAFQHRHFRLIAISIMSTCVAANAASAQILSLSYPEPSNNAAAHYNRALLALSSIPVEDREILARPIWESLGDLSRDQISALLEDLVYQGRHAIRAALHGSSQRVCDFGIDYSDFGHGGAAPHATPMLRLGRLVTMAGIQAQIEGEQEKSALFFFDALRMGRHLANQPTLIEGFVGIEMMENAYFSLAFWGTRCTDTALVGRAFTRLELASESGVNPARTLAYEAAIISRQVDRLLDAYPDGAWGEMLLEAMDEFAASSSDKKLEDKAIEILAKRGIPSEAFKDRRSFEAITERYRKVNTAYFREAATYMALPPMQRAKRTHAMYAKYKPLFEKLGDPNFLDVRQIGNHFATHEAELTMARVALAVCAERKNGKFPASLDAVSDRFAGPVPVSPYDGSLLEYKVLNDGEDFLLVVPEAKYQEMVMPRVEFSSVRQEPADHPS